MSDLAVRTASKISYEKFAKFSDGSKNYSWSSRTSGFYDDLNLSFFVLF